MKKNITLLNHLLNIFLLIFLTVTAFSQHQLAEEKLKTLEEKDFGKWERLGFRGTSISNDGRWLIYPISRNNKKNELRLHNLSENTVKIIEKGESQVFSNDSKWLGYLILPDEKKQKKIRGRTPPSRKALELINLTNGKTTRIKDVTYFSFSNDGKFLVLEPYPDSKAKSQDNIIVRDLMTQKDIVFGNVKEYDWSGRNSILAMIISTDDKIGNGIKVFDGKSTLILDNEKAFYSSLTWREESNDLAVFRSHETKGFEEDTNDILVWKDVFFTGSISPKVFDYEKMKGFPNDMRILNGKSLNWSLDGNSLFFSIDKWTRSPQEIKKKIDKDQPPIPALEIWNSSDVRTIPEQKRRSDDNSYLSVWHLDSNKFFQLGDRQLETVKFQADSKMMLAFDNTPYDFKAMFGRPSSDVFSINIKDGTKKKLLENIIYVETASPAGDAFVYLKDDHYHLYNFATEKSINLTKDIDASFVDLDDDHPVEQKSSYGFVGWDKTGAYVVIHSEFDIWKFDTSTGEGTRLTDGKSEEIINRWVRSDDSKTFVDLNDAIYVRRFGKWSKKSGYAKLINGNSLQNIYWGDALATRLNVAKNADVAVFTIEKYGDAPDFFVSEKGSSDIRQVSEINAFEDEYKNGKAELIEYKNANGKKLQGILYYPDDYEAGKKYPMITYIYEKLSDGFHRYEIPAKGSYYNTRIFTSKGFFVLKPDILFDAGDPGVSSVKTLEIAVKTVVDKGIVDEKKVGLVGHSWGGYQTAFAVTRTNIFAAAVAGAGISNLITMYGTITPSFGNTFESRHSEVSQERMRVPPWEDIDGYLRNSAIPNVHKMQTPLLMEVGDADTNVNWRQGIEMYNAARRAKKEMVLLVYAQEGHGLQQDKNKIDYQRRILEWFGHYLKGDPPKRWIKDNISYSEQKELLEKRELE